MDLNEVNSGRLGYTEPETSNLPLDQPRVIAIKDGKHTYTFFFRRISAEDWDQYFSGIYCSSRQEDNTQHNIVDVSTCGVELVQRCLIDATGYVSTFDTRKPGWQQKIPLRHADPVSWILRTVSRSEEEIDAAFDPEIQDVMLQAAWSHTSTGPKIDMYKGLLHRLTAPSVDDMRRYLRARSSSRIVGGTRNGATVYASRHRVLIELYDKLIHSVDGYSVAGTPLGTNRDLIRREMDSYHKVQAATLLFARPEIEAVGAE